MSLVQRYIGEDFMARHEFKIFSPNGPGREPRLRPEAPARREPRPAGSATGEERRGHAERRDGSPDHDREQFWALFVPKRSRS